jgi:hypothetical protein
MNNNELHVKESVVVYFKAISKIIVGKLRKTEDVVPGVRAEN